MGTAGSAAIKGVDFAGKTGSAQTVSNDFKKKMSAANKSLYKDNGWFVGVTPRRNPEIVVACLFEGGEHGALAARVASKVIKAYVEKQRTRQTEVAKANGTAGTKQAEVAAVWHDGDAKQPDKLQAGRYTVAADGKSKPVAAAPGVETANTPAIPAADLESNESHQEMAKPEDDTSDVAKPTPPSLQPSGTPSPNATTTPNAKKPAPSPTAVAPTAPTATAVPVRQP